MLSTEIYQKLTSMNLAMSFLSRLPILKVQVQNVGFWRTPRPLNRFAFPQFHPKCRSPALCSQLSSWEPSPIKYAPTDDESDGNFLKASSNIFESMVEEETAEAPIPPIKLQCLKWPMWLLGPLVLLITGMAPTLWLPLSSVFLGPNIASLLSLMGLDCIFNIGATLFLLMSDAIARSEKVTLSDAPFSYRFWNMVAGLMGFIIPLSMFFASHKGLLQPQISSISFAALLGPYFLLLSIQMLTEVLTWHWKSPVWLMTPVVYEAYRVLQLMRGLRLCGDIVAPIWIVETIRGLVSWWVLILGMQLMRVAWFAGFTAQSANTRE
ncbi:hypothetical protein GIB67_036487 [Kingdonia uniflora]|uniref:Uncharacterized protein n=1 Tax=Kingdonia uniflora TaxID=39325 RepID=A0A7J7P7I5_9MAGN|nr:hypothetical protein GIB67_036487 [Kingdonia uniflora]